MSVKGLIVTLFIAIAGFGVAQAADLRSTSDVDSVRFAEYNSIFGGGVVAGYTVEDRQVRMDDMGMKGGEMMEGEKCGMHEDGGCCHHDCGCNCPGAAYDCWGVWQTDDWSDFAATRDSDYDPVMGRGEYGRSWFW